LARKIALEYYSSFTDSSGFIPTHVIPDLIQARRFLDVIQNGAPEFALLLSFGISSAISTAFLFINRRLGVIGFGFLILLGFIHWMTPYVYFG
jgi:hypothetical protein